MMGQYVEMGDETCKPCWDKLRDTRAALADSEARVVELVEAVKEAINDIQHEVNISHVRQFLTSVLEAPTLQPFRERLAKAELWDALHKLDPEPAKAIMERDAALAEIERLKGLLERAAVTLDYYASLHGGEFASKMLEEIEAIATEAPAQATEGGERE